MKTLVFIRQSHPETKEKYNAQTQFIGLFIRENQLGERSLEEVEVAGFGSFNVHCPLLKKFDLPGPDQTFFGLRLGKFFPGQGELGNW